MALVKTQRDLGLQGGAAMGHSTQGGQETGPKFRLPLWAMAWRISRNFWVWLTLVSSPTPPRTPAGPVTVLQRSSGVTGFTSRGG